MKRIVSASVYNSTAQAAQIMGQNIRAARQARGWTMAEAAERSVISLNTYKKIEAGDPSVAFGFWLQTFYQLDLLQHLAQATSPHVDQLGEALRKEKAVQRVRNNKKEPAKYDF